MAHVFNYSGEKRLRYSTPHCALVGWIQRDEMTGCVGEALDPRLVDFDQMSLLFRQPTNGDISSA